ncbi:hypothetical protein [Caldiplasma sukawensis]
MEIKTLKYLAGLFIALTIVMAGVAVFEYSSYSAKSSDYSSLKTNYNSQQASVVLDAAYSHWNYISIENSSLLNNQYESNATLTWIGGPLAGKYMGESNIISTWNKFFNAWSAVWFYTINPPSVSVSGNEAYVNSLNQFIVTPANNQNQVQYINVSYTLNYTNVNNTWLISGEIWHIVGAGFISSTQEFTINNYVENLAFNHWNNIAIENVSAVMTEYASNATLYWVGGSLNGTYKGYTSINSTWTKFFNAWSAVWFYTESPPTIVYNGNEVKVSAPVQFVVQNAANTSQFKFINVTYTIVYSFEGFNVSKGMPNFLITSETFMITGINSLSKI